MSIRRGLVGLRPYAAAAVVVAGLLWCLSLLALRETPLVQPLSNFGLFLGALTAGAVALARGMRHSGADRRFWLLIGAAVLSWSAGQGTWTLLETLLGREVPFPSPADLGYLGLPPLAAAALLTLPMAVQTTAGRVRTILDGLMVATSLLVCSWILVLRHMFEVGADSLMTATISLAYPVGDIVVMTMVVTTWLRVRRTEGPLLVPLGLVGSGLFAFAVADSGFTYTTTNGTYSSGSVIDLGWFLGFTLILLAALRSPAVRAEGPAVEDRAGRLPSDTLLPYAAVTLALATSAVEIYQSGSSDPVVSWCRTVLIVLLVVRQVLTLLENQSLTRHLEDRVTQRTADLQTSEQRFVALVQHSSDVVTVVDPEGLVLYQSGSIQRILGYAPERLEGRPVFHLMGEPEAAVVREALGYAAAEDFRIHTVQTSWRHADGRRCRVEVTITNLLSEPHVGGLVLNTRDVTDRVVLEEQLTGMAFTDSLTALPNRALFKDRLQHALTRRASRTSVAVLFMDLDGFKSVNDTLGHSAGDDLLVRVAERLREVVRPSDTVARFGGDEFAVLVDDLAGEGAAIDLARRINAVMREPFCIRGERVHVGVSVGIARLDRHADTAEQVLRNADLAMYAAKSAGDGGFVVFAPEMHVGLVERVRLESDLRAAVDGGQLVLHYQPMVSLRSGAVTGVEALVRWQHPERGLLPPSEFIPVAESTGMVQGLGQWVLREACHQVAAWCAARPKGQPLRVSVNVSPRQLHHGRFAEEVQAVLTESGLPPERLTLEMTESVLVDDREQTLATLTDLHDLGVRLAIDDFGTGYSSLSYLHRFPVDVLKIDRSFIERLSTGGDAALVSTIIRLGQSLALETVAEGIERPQEMLMLRRQGCTTGQGYHFSPPVPAAEMAAMLGVAGARLADEPTSA